MFHDHKLTRHAEVRMRQRGLRNDDIRLLLTAASQISRDVYLLTERDTAREIAKCKRKIQSLERLNGCKVVVEQGCVVTCYHTGKETRKKTIRYGRAQQ